MKSFNNEPGFLLPFDVMELISKLPKEFIGDLMCALIDHYEGKYQYVPEDPAVDSVMQLIVPTIDCVTEKYRVIINEND